MAEVVLEDLVEDLVADPIAEHVAVITIIGVTILVINVIRGIIITILEDLVVILAEVVTSEVVIAITEIVTAEVDTQIAIHVPVHIQVLVGDLATNAITLVDGKFIFTFFSIVYLEIFILVFNKFFTFLICFLTKIQLIVYTFFTGGEMELTAPILGKRLHLPPLQIMAVVLLILVTPKFFEFAFINFLVQTYQLK